MYCQRALEQLGGVAARRHLVGLGVSDHQIAQEMRSGRVVRVRQGWYAIPGHPAIPSIQLRGTPTCVTAGRIWGLWVGGDQRIHLRTPEHYGGPSPTRSAKIVPHRNAQRWPRRNPWLDSVEDTLRCICLCQDEETAVAAVDSALNRGLITQAALEEVRQSLPVRHRGVFDFINGQAESGLESLVRFRLERVGINPQLQATVVGVGRVDLLVGRLIIECDGRQFHEKRFEEDRNRDANAALNGYRSLRFSYQQITEDAHTVTEAILRVLSEMRAADAFPAKRALISADSLNRPSFFGGRRGTQPIKQY